MVKIRCNENGKVYPTLRDCYLDLKFSKASMRKYLNGEVSHVKGYTFEILENHKGYGLTNPMVSVIETSEAVKTRNEMRSQHPDRLWLIPKSERVKMGIKEVLVVVGCLHLPYSVDGWLEFIIDTMVTRGATEIVFNGDVIDSNTISRWGLNPDNPLSAISEYEKSLNDIKKLYEVFPEATWVEGNHDRRLARFANGYKIPGMFIKSLEELYGIPDDWSIVDNYKWNGIFIEHGERNGSQTAAIEHAKMNGNQSTIISHLHAQASISYRDFGAGMFMSVSTGTLLDDNSIAALYNKHSRYKGVTSIVVVYDKLKAEIVPYLKVKS